MKIECKYVVVFEQTVLIDWPYKKCYICNSADNLNWFLLSFVYDMFVATINCVIMYKELKCMFSWVFDVTVHTKKKKKN